MASSGEGGRAAALPDQGVWMVAPPDLGIRAAAASGPCVRVTAAYGRVAHAAAAAFSGPAECAAAAFSGPGECAAAAFAGPGECAAAAFASPGECAGAVVSGEAEHAVAASGKRKRTLFSLDYPCTARFRFRRFLSYLREYSCDQIYDVAKEELCVIFHVEDLVEKVKAGKLEEAYDYVRTFATIKESSNEAELLALFLEHIMAISRFADGNTMEAGRFCDWFRSMYKHPALNKYPCFATLVADALFMRTYRLRNSMNWQLVRNKAAEMVEELANKAPDLKERMHYPRCQNELYDVMPIRSCFHRRRQVKSIGRKQPTDLAQCYLQLKKRLPSSDQVECHDNSGSARNQREMLIALLDKALQAGKRMVIDQGHPPEYLIKGAFPLVALLAYKSIPERLREQGYLREHTCNQGTKHLRFQYTAHPGNDLNRPQTTGNFGELRSSDKMMVCNSQGVVASDMVCDSQGVVASDMVCDSQGVMASD